MNSSYQRPQQLRNALDMLAEAPLTIVAGGTDYFPARVGRPLNDAVLDITALDELRGISLDGDVWRIGAATTWTELIRADLPPLFDGYRLAAREVGGLQIQNAGTLAGNICNASPAADGTPVLLSLDARVEVSSRNSVREIPIEDFVVGNRATALEPHELVTAILIPAAATGTVSDFIKLGARRYLVISIAMVSGTLSLGSDGLIADARLAIGSCSEVARRLPYAEAALIGAIPDAAIAERIEPSHLETLTPISDVRATDIYRRNSAFTITRRLVAQLGRSILERRELTP